MATRKNQFRALIFKLFLRSMAMLSLPAAHRFAKLLGQLMWRYSKKTRRVIQRNIEMCFPELTPEQQLQLARESTIETAKTFTELGAMWLWPIEKTDKLIAQVSGEEHVKAAFEQNKGIIFISPHLGAWELAGLYCSRLGNMTTLYRPPRISQMEDIIRKARERTNANLVPTDSKGVRQLLQALKRGDNTGILPDQDPGAGNGIFAPFFGISTNTMTLVSRLAQKSKSPVILCYAERLENGEGFHIHLVPLGEEVGDRDLEASITHINQVVEETIRINPAQYQWSYKRFKTRPEGEESFY